MIGRYRTAFVVAAVGLVAVLTAVLGQEELAGLSLFVAAAATPLAVLLAVRSRMGIPAFPRAALVGGAVVGGVVALVGHVVAGGFVGAFVLGFAELARELLESLRTDPRVSDVLSSPWVVVLLIQVTVVAPIAEEVGKTLGAWLGRPTGRREAFLAGVAAGTGFAVLENLLYAGVGAAYGEPWPAVIAARALGAAVHPLATGLVALGWWEWRNERDLGALARRFLAGVGIHALWNGTAVVVAVVGTAVEMGGAPQDMGSVSLAFAAVLGAVFAGGLWIVTVRVAEGRSPSLTVEWRRVQPVAAWVTLTALILVPAALLVLAFPDFYGG
jgi:RsiW-degrading membrane proteinase PrsW (M82 family)